MPDKLDESKLDIDKLTLNKQLQTKVADKFSAAASQYHKFNYIQQMSCEKLLSSFNAEGVLLDIGAGPGTDFSQFTGLNRVVALDIAPQMLQQLELDYPHYLTVCADAHAIPLQHETVDCIYSNLALQWCSDLTKVFEQFHHVLSCDGEIHISIVAQGSLAEVEQLGMQVNSFLSLSEIQAHLNPTQWLLIEATTEPYQLYFDSLKTLLYSIKGVGASIKTQQQTPEMTRGLRGRAHWLALQERASQIQSSKGYQLSYNIVHLHYKKIS